MVFSTMIIAYRRFAVNCNILAYIRLTVIGAVVGVVFNDWELIGLFSVLPVSLFGGRNAFSTGIFA